MGETCGKKITWENALNIIVLGFVLLREKMGNIHGWVGEQKQKEK